MKINKEEFLQRAKEYAISKGGNCLSNEYINSKAKLEWKCNNGNHPAWYATTKIIHNNSWCKLCK